MKIFYFVFVINKKIESDLLLCMLENDTGSCIFCENGYFLSYGRCLGTNPFHLSKNDKKNNKNNKKKS